MKNTYVFRHREFLNPISDNKTSYIFAHVESSYGGSYSQGDNLIFIADCHRVIELEFFIGNKLARKQSLAKLDLLIRVLTSFRAALAQEIARLERWGK